MYIILYSINLFIIFYIKYDCDFLNLLLKNLRNYLLSCELPSYIYSVYLNEVKRREENKKKI